VRSDMIRFYSIRSAAGFPPLFSVGAKCIEMKAVNGQSHFAFGGITGTIDSRTLELAA
jgi:hypothetical protein